MRISANFQLSYPKTMVNKAQSSQNKQNVQNNNYNYSSNSISFSSGYPADYNNITPWYGYVYTTTQKGRYNNMSIDDAIQEVRTNYHNSRPGELKPVAMDNVMAGLGARLYNDADAMVKFANLYGELHPDAETDEYKLFTLYTNTSIRTGRYNRKPEEYGPSFISKMQPAVVLDYVEKVDMSPKTLDEFLRRQSDMLTTQSELRTEENSARIFGLLDKAVKGHSIPDMKERIAKNERIDRGEEPEFIQTSPNCSSCNRPDTAMTARDAVVLINRYSDFIPKESKEEYAEIKEYFINIIPEGAKKWINFD